MRTMLAFCLFSALFSFSGCTFKQDDLVCATCPLGKIDPGCYAMGGGSEKKASPIEEKTLVQEKKSSR